jgi:hypothetical protein
MKIILIAMSISWVTVICHAQPRPVFTGSNSCEVRIETSNRKYFFQSNGMIARLDDVQKRFEFIVPFPSIRMLGDTVDIEFVRSLCSGKDIILYASLSDDKDPELDFSPFKGNTILQLAGEFRIGNFVFEDNVDFKGLIVGFNQNEMAFNVGLFLNSREMPIRIGDEQLVEIEFAGKGDKIIGLTSND